MLNMFAAMAQFERVAEIANRGYEGAASTDPKLQAEAVSLFVSDTLWGRVTPSHRRDTVTSEPATTSPFNLEIDLRPGGAVNRDKEID